MVNNLFCHYNHTKKQFTCKQPLNLHFNKTPPQNGGITDPGMARIFIGAWPSVNCFNYFIIILFAFLFYDWLGVSLIKSYFSDIYLISVFGLH